MLPRQVIFALCLTVGCRSCVTWKGQVGGLRLLQSTAVWGISNTVSRTWKKIQTRGCCEDPSHRFLGQRADFIANLAKPLIVDVCII